MASIDTWTTRFVLDVRDYIKNTYFAGMSTQQFGRKFGSLNNYIKSVRKATRDWISDLTSLQRKMERVGHTIANAFRSGIATWDHFLDVVTRITNPLTQIGQRMLEFASATIQTSAELQGLYIGLEAITGSASEAAKQWKLIREVAKLPGINFQAAAEGVAELQASGMAADTAFRATIAFGNALASIGKSSYDMKWVNLALGQIARKGKVYAEEILQLQERLPQIGPAIRNAFGTGNTEVLAKMGIDSQTFIEGIIREFEKLPSVAKGARVMWENLKDTATLAMGQIGDTLNDKLAKPLEVIDSYLRWMVESGVLKKIASGFTDMFSMDGRENDIVRIMSYMAALLQNLPNMLTTTANNIGKFFDWVLDKVKWSVAAYAGVMGFKFGIQLASTVLILIKAFRTLRAAILSAGLAEVIIESIITGGASLTKAAIGLALGTAAAIAAYKGIEKLLDGGKLGIDNFIGFDPAKIQQDADKLYDQFMNRVETPVSLRFGQGAYNALGDTNTYLKGIEKNTRDVAELGRTILGGSEITKLGATPVEIARMKGAGRNRGNRLAQLITEEIQRAAADMYYRDLRRTRRHA